MADIFLLFLDPQRIFLPQLEEAVFRSAGYKVLLPSSAMAAAAELAKTNVRAAVLVLPAGQENALENVAVLRAVRPALPLMLLAERATTELYLAARRIQANEVATAPLNAEDVRTAIERLLAAGALPASPNPLSELETLAHLGKSITSKLNPDDVLTSIVEAAVRLTGAEEGSLMLVDSNTGELYMRASKNFDQQFVQTFRVKVQDTLAGEVIRTREPILLDANSPRKIKTSFLVHSLVFVPLMVGGRAIGLLGVDNRAAGRPLTDRDLTLMQALAEYAVIALENARRYDFSQSNLRQWEAILQQVEDGVLITDPDGMLLLINRAARETLDLRDEKVVGQPLAISIPQPELQMVFSRRTSTNPLMRRVEIALADGKVFNAHLTPIEGVGFAIVMQDITRLKELDRVKSEFVAAVSHDLRSPLTTILGYVDLIERAGPVTPQQKEFIGRIQNSVQNITALIADLLDLGKIESGMDSQKEPAPLNALIRSAVDGLHNRADAKHITLEMLLGTDVPSVFGNPVRLRQMAANLIDNAIKYSTDGSKVRIMTKLENGQVLFQVSDFGIGIPATEMPFIFNKFFRASNVQGSAGTGLGLSIVKSIIDMHGGRIWVDSPLGTGTTFTIVLPAPHPDANPRVRKPETPAAK
jgi:two-component system, OmpR family, phosphate regulon sensor histidine kinase PhoR